MSQAWMEELQAVLERSQSALDVAALAEFKRRVLGVVDAWAEIGVSAASDEEDEEDEEPMPSRFGILGQSPAMNKVFDLLERIIKSDYPVLVTGASGTGKELVARALHNYGARRRRNFVSENCAAIPEMLLESILFGHKKGSFTGAHRDNPGHFVTAHKGTLFLDELGDMPLVMQGKLLRTLQDGEIRPVGSSKIRKVDVRLVAATNKDLQAMVAAKSFREDLFYRLNVLAIHLPPLAERGDDILLLAEFFLRKARREQRRPLILSDDARERLLAAPWPGNVRQLENEIRRAVALSDGGGITARDLTI